LSQGNLKINPVYCHYDCPIVLYVKVPEEPHILLCNNYSCQKMHRRQPNGWVYTYYTKEQMRDRIRGRDKDVFTVRKYATKCDAGMHVCAMCYPHECKSHKQGENENPSQGAVKLILEKSI